MKIILQKYLLLHLFLFYPIFLFAQEIDLTPDASFLGTHHAERIGYALSGGGDVNGDGLADFLVGSFHNQTFGQDAGAAYLVLGQSPNGRAMYDSLAGCGIRFLGESKFQAVGFSLANNGDLNGDGFDDLLIGAPAGNPRLRSPGKVYLVYGKSTPDWGYQCMLANSANGAISGEADWDRFGMSVAYVGDVNADGLDDFIVGTPDNDRGNSGAGKVYFFLGRNTDWSRAALAGQEARATFICERPDANLGFSVAGVGDVNADGIPDFVVGAPGINKTFLMFGRRDTGWKNNFDIEEQADVIFSGENYNGDMNGYAVAAAGDVNGDGISDFVISAIHFRANGQLAGKVYVVFGRQNGWSDQNFKLANADASFKGELPGDMAGWSVSGAGDVNGDGCAEIVIGMFNEENKKNVPGKAWIIAGKTDYWPRNTELSSLPAFIGENNYQLCGFCVGHAGDVDGDRWSDFLVAAPYFSPDSSGNVYLFRAKRPQAKISGVVNYFQSQTAVPNVALQLTGDFEDSTASAASGVYQFNVYQFADYQLEISPIPPAPECLSAYDAALTARAALHLDSFSDDQKIAGDVDANGQISVFDATLILRGSLGLPAIHGSFAGEWRALTANLKFSAVRADLPDQNLKLLVCGDVDASWAPNRLLARPGVLEQSQTAIPGAEIIVPINFPAAQNILAFDAKVFYQPEHLEFVGIKKTELTNHFTLSHAETNSGELRLGAFTVEPQSSAGTYATIHFKVKLDFTEKTELRLVSLKMNHQTQPETHLTLVSQRNAPQNYTFQLLPNFPNPFNSGTRVEYRLAQKSRVELAIFNTVGQKICTLLNNLQERGEYRVTWNGATDTGQPVPSGIYFIKIQADDFQQTRKITLLR